MQIHLPNNPRPQGARKRSTSNSSHQFPMSELIQNMGSQAEPRNNLDLSKPPVIHGYVKSFDGTKLFYSIEGKGKPLVFCYGLVCSSLHWTYQIEHFRKEYQTIWFDYRGHQNSEIPQNLNSLTLENMARDLGIVLDELNIRNAVFLGHSMGVNVVLEYYKQQPHRFAGMILANGTAQRPLETLFRSNILQAGFHFFKKIYRKSPGLVSILLKMQKGNPLARTLVALGGFNPHLTPQADIELYIDQVIGMDPAILIHLIENYDVYDANAWLHTIQAPTLILAGEQDNVIPVEQQELMHQLIPKSQLEIIRHGSHCPQMDLPDLVNLRIEKFLNFINYGIKPNLTTEIASQSTDLYSVPG